jgi:toxin YhaV
LTEPHWAERYGWKLFMHPAFRRQYDALIADVESLKVSLSPESFAAHGRVKLLARVNKLVLDDIPADPQAKMYELGNTLGPNRRHWRRAKFFQRFRLFFRFQSTANIIVYAWMNDERTLRARGARTDVYEAFKRRLLSGDPPDGWDQLLDDCT